MTGKKIGCVLRRINTKWYYKVNNFIGNEFRIKIKGKFMLALDEGASSFNSTITEIDEDKLWISH
jgi:hypothetical protein